MKFSSELTYAQYEILRHAAKSSSVWYDKQYLELPKKWKNWATGLLRSYHMNNVKSLIDLKCLENDGKGNIVITQKGKEILERRWQ